tara:strand:- start:2841 stop:3827 length:987 start_codon:yes stop_codon:yes gene_type:complete
VNLREILTSSLVSVIPTGALHFVIVDVPDHPNVGDSAIFLGEYDFIKTNYPNASINIVDYQSYSSGQYKLLEQADCIFFHGGGNFGDLWMRHQNIRLKVMEQFSHKVLIQFPQSIHFDTEEVLERTKNTIAKCKTFVFFVRDVVSEKFALDNFKCSVKLAPDMAFCMHKIVKERSEKDVFCLMRIDKERLHDKSDEIEKYLKSESFSFLIDDWVVEKAPFKASLNKLLCKLIKIFPGSNRLIQPVYESLRLAYAKDNVRRGINLLSKGELVITDRLHAFILSSLLGIENYVFDSRGGKVGNFHRTWAKNFTHSHLVADMTEIKLNQKN